MIRPRQKLGSLLAGHRPARFLVIMALALVLLAWGMSGVQIWERRQHAFDEETQILSLLSLSLASQMDRDFQTIDMVLRDAQKLLQDPEGQKYWTPQAAHELFRNYLTGLPLVYGLGLIDKDGGLVAGTGLSGQLKVKTADRPYFTEFLHDPSDHLYVSQPILNRVSGHWTLFLTRPLSNQQGFLGICGATIELDRLNSIFQREMPLQSGAVTFLRSDGVVLARWPQAPNVIGKSMIGADMIAQGLANSPDGVLRQVGGADRTAGIYAYKKLANYPLLIGVSISENQMYAAWRRESAGVLGFCMAVTCVVTLLMLQVLRQMALALDRENALQESESSLRRAQQVARIGSWHMESQGAPIECSDECRRILGVTSGTQVSMALLQSLALPEDRLLLSGAQIGMWQGEVRELEIRIMADGEMKWIKLLADLKNSTDGQVLEIVGTIQDVTEAKLAEQQIRFLGYFDALTELPNRVLIRDRVERFMLAAQRVPANMALLFLDLDNFKTINDTLGHSVGDSLLKEIALRLAESVRKTDTVARHGGDEFLIALMHAPGADSIKHVVDTILTKMGQPFSIDGQELNASFSIGVALFPDDADDFDTLLRKADLAMYKAKDAGRNTCRYFLEDMNRTAEENMQVRNALHRALERNELELYFQPQVRVSDGAVVSAEALLRWQHPTMGWVPPVRFIPVAESSGLMVPIGAWVLDEACRQAVSWQRAGFPEVGVAVNISPIQFRQTNLHDGVTAALQKSGLEARWLELELTESILIHGTDNVLQTVRALKGLGVAFSIDDFGTGYSSLAYLKRFEVDKLKIDQSFVRDLHTDPGDAAIVRAIIQMAHAMKLETIAEGVETEEQREFLQTEQCDTLQGYLFAEPMPADKFLLFLQKHSAGAAAKLA